MSERSLVDQVASRRKIDHVSVPRKVVALLLGKPANSGTVFRWFASTQYLRSSPGREMPLDPPLARR